MRRYLGPILMAGIIGLVIAPVVAPTLARLLRPVAKGAVRGGVSLYQRGRVVVAELVETTEDLVAEATHDLGNDAKS